MFSNIWSITVYHWLKNHLGVEVFFYLAFWINEVSESYSLLPKVLQSWVSFWNANSSFVKTTQPNHGVTEKHGAHELSFCWAALRGEVFPTAKVFTREDCQKTYFMSHARETLFKCQLFVRCHVQFFGPYSTSSQFYAAATDPFGVFPEENW